MLTFTLGTYCCVARNCMGEAQSFASLTIEDIQEQLNESEKLSLKEHLTPPGFTIPLQNAEPKVGDPYSMAVQSKAMDKYIFHMHIYFPNFIFNCQIQTISKRFTSAHTKFLFLG